MKPQFEMLRVILFGLACFVFVCFLVCLDVRLFLIKLKHFLQCNIIISE